MKEENMKCGACWRLEFSRVIQVNGRRQFVCEICFVGFRKTFSTKRCEACGQWCHDTNFVPLRDGEAGKRLMVCQICSGEDRFNQKKVREIVDLLDQELYDKALNEAIKEVERHGEN